VETGAILSDNKFVGMKIAKITVSLDGPYSDWSVIVWLIRNLTLDALLSNFFMNLRLTVFAICILSFVDLQLEHHKKSEMVLLPTTCSVPKELSRSKKKKIFQ